jgi:putative Holliday junction resolvase
MIKRVLGIDIGLKRTGLAVSDALGIGARPLANRVPQSRKQDVDFVLSLTQDLNVETIVIGYPVLPRSGREGAMARRARGFKEALETGIKDLGYNIIVILSDECYTSKRAVTRLIESGIKKNKRLTLLDSEVARILVEEYLATKPEGGSS